MLHSPFDITLELSFATATILILLGAPIAYGIAFSHRMGPSWGTPRFIDAGLPSCGSGVSSHGLVQSGPSCWTTLRARLWSSARIPVRGSCCGVDDLQSSICVPPPVARISSGDCSSAPVETIRMNPLLSVDIARSFQSGRRILARFVILEEMQGRVLVVTGESGSGRSTLLRMLSGLISPDTVDLLEWGCLVRFAER